MMSRPEVTELIVTRKIEKKTELGDDRRSGRPKQGMDDGRPAWPDDPD